MDAVRLGGAERLAVLRIGLMPWQTWSVDSAPGWLA
ncbi:hypothetical protein SUDANB96_02968 [Streptomyces sp. enrichment culture]